MFVNQTMNDVETNALAGKHINRRYKIIFGAVISPVFIILGVALLVLDIYLSDEPDYFFPVLLMVMGVLLLVYALCFDIIVLKIGKKLADGKEADVTFTFNDDGYEFVATSDGANSSLTGEYSAFTKCDEYSDMWLLYYNKINMYIMKKDGMREGTAEEFSAFLQEKLGQKYKVKYKNRKKVS